MKNLNKRDIYSRDFVLYDTILALLRRIEKGSFANIIIPSVLEKSNFTPAEKSAINEVTNQLIIWKKKLNWIIDQFYREGHGKLEHSVKYLLWFGIYHIYIKKNPKEYFVVDSIVEYTKQNLRRTAAKLLNAILRNLIRNKESIQYPDKVKEPEKYFSIYFSHPEWIVKRWLGRYGLEITKKILKANNSIPAVSLRINLSRTSIQEIENYLSSENINYEISSDIPGFIILKENFPVIESKIFTEGMVSIQDLSSGIAPYLFRLSANSTIVDACAAPGSKSFHLSEIYKNKISIFSVDININRIKFIVSGRRRLKIKNVFPVSADSRYLPFKTVENIILDVPCSSTGTFNKRADIRWNLTERKIKDLVNIQKEIIQNTASLLKPGGFLVYSTCTIEHEENEEVINWFTGNNKNFKILEPDFFINSKLKKDSNFIKTVQGVDEHMNGSFSILLQKAI